MSGLVEWWLARRRRRTERAMWDAVAFAYVYGSDGAAEWAMRRLGLSDD